MRPPGVTTQGRTNNSFVAGAIYMCQRRPGARAWVCISRDIQDCFPSGFLTLKLLFVLEYIQEDLGEEAGYE